ncbi:MAG: PKD domain-containing protein [Halobacteriales archaeon]
MFDDTKSDRTGERFDWRTILRRRGLAAKYLTHSAVSTDVADDADPGSGDEAGNHVDRRTLLQTLGAGVGAAGLASTAGLAAPDGCPSDSRVDVTAVDTTNYPEIQVQVQIKTSAAETGLDRSAFTVREDGTTRSPLTCFQKLDEGGGGKVDIAYVFDDSHSMSGEIDALEDEAESLAQTIEDRGLDGRYAMVTFYDTEDQPFDDGDDQVEIDERFTSDPSKLQDVFSDGGTQEPNLDAIYLAATGLDWRDDAQKVIINACDESNSNTNVLAKSTVETKLQDEDMTVHGIVNPDDANIRSRDLPAKTGGTLIDITETTDFASTLNDLIEEIAEGQYKLCYETPLLCTGATRDVSVCVDDPDAGSIGASGTYDAPTSGEGCNRPPEAVCAVSFPGEVPATGESITFDGSGSSDPNGDALTYEWDFDGDGSTDATGETVDHTFTTGGEKTVVLTVTDEHGLSDTCELTFTVWIAVEINIKPGSDPNAVNCNSKGGTPVAVLTTDGFDATRVDPSSLRFGAPSDVIDGDGAGIIHEGGHFEDAEPDHGSTDGDTDFVGHFATPDTGFDGSQDTGRLEGETQDGTPLVGTDSVTLVGCGGGSKDRGGG